jgi:hypothetical protein
MIAKKKEGETCGAFIRRVIMMDRSPTTRSRSLRVSNSAAVQPPGATLAGTAPGSGESASRMFPMRKRAGKAAAKVKPKRKKKAKAG